jgi:hypothetical protein
MRYVFVDTFSPQKIENNAKDVNPLASHYSNRPFISGEIIE